MPSLLQLSKMFQTPIALLRLEQAIRVVALEVQSEALAGGATQQEQQTYLKRQAVAREWGKAPAHWARVVGPTLSGLSALVAYVDSWESETLDSTLEASMDADLLAAIRLKVADYLSAVVV